MSKYVYNSWPLGKVSKDLQRPELEIIKEIGYHWSDPRDVIDMFEEKIAKFAGSKFAVSVDCCSNGLFLCMKYLQSISSENKKLEVTIPNRTYVSVAMQIKHAGWIPKFDEINWNGVYQLGDTRIWDGAGRYTKDMYLGGDVLQVLSFQIKKKIPIGKGGVILTDDEQAYNWLKLASYDGRDLRTPYTDENHVRQIGWHMYMTPEDAARGIILMDKTPEINEDFQNDGMYPEIKELLKNINLYE
jgi:dTDP-4-amino-4,6-dideoxygalactose transaminase